METTMQKSLNMLTAYNTELEVQKEQHVDNDFKMIAFSLGGKDYAIDILKVKEIANADRFTYVPNTAKFVVGVYNLRGEIIPVIDLRTFFNLEKAKKENIAVNDENSENMIIVNIGDQKYGTIVDEIEQVISIQSSLIQPPHPLFGDINIKYIYGIVEHTNNLYILLDIDRIFGKENSETYEKNEIKLIKPEVTHTETAKPAARKSMDDILSEKHAELNVQTVAKPVKTSSTPIAEAPKKETVNIDFSFIKDTLKKYQNITVTQVNEAWMQERFTEWKQQKGTEATLSNPSDASQFLQPFFSICNGQFWTKAYADAVYALLPDNTAKQIHVWNPGCGTGYEAYSLACILKKRYPNARCKVFAHDIDLIAISSAPVLRIPDDLENSWYSPYLTKSVSEDLVFTTDITDSILFEYHDCTNTNSMPPIDLIFCRDVLSYMSENNTDKMLSDFHEVLKDAGILILGDNELLIPNNKWQKRNDNNLNAYNKYN